MRSCWRTDQTAIINRRWRPRWLWNWRSRPDMIKSEKLFESFFLGGFECSTHRLATGKRLDEIAATQHDRFAREDYLRLRSVGIRGAREGLRWHLIEAIESQYDFSSAVRMIRTARETKTQTIWDL